MLALRDLHRHFAIEAMAKESTRKGIRQHSAKLPEQLDERVVRCMKLEGIASFAEFVRNALTRRCREIERENGIDAEGRPLHSS